MVVVSYPERGTQGGISLFFLVVFEIKGLEGESYKPFSSPELISLCWVN